MRYERGAIEIAENPERSRVSVGTATVDPVHEHPGSRPSDLIESEDVGALHDSCRIGLDLVDIGKLGDLTSKKVPKGTLIEIESVKEKLVITID